MNLSRKSLALGCALGIAGCAQGGISTAIPNAAAPAGFAPGDHSQTRARHHSAGNPLLYNFLGYPDGNDPVAGLVNVGGTLYGTTYYGGTNNLGAVFAVTAGGSESIVHSFSGADGEFPEASLTDVNGTLYGTTSNGSGSNSYGNVFSFNPSDPSATFKVVYSFQKNGSNDGIGPAADMTYAKGALYGTTAYGGNASYGTVFKIELSGKHSGQESVVYNFKGAANGGPDGARPLAGVLYDGTKLYGTTYEGGKYSDGTVFSLSPSSGEEKVLYSFGATSSDGIEPQGDLLVYNGTLYGTTAYGGPADINCGPHASCGTVFEIKPNGSKYKTVYAFHPGNQSSGKEDGLRPLAGLLNVGGTFYGTTLDSAPDGEGTVFSVTPGGTETPVAVFGCGASCSGPTPANPFSALINVGGVLYGTTTGTEGARGDGYGTVFAL